MMIDKPEYLYLHVPFCKTICSYCDFCHVGYQEKLAEAWLDTIQKDIQQRTLNTQLKTIYIGGGTPTALTSTQLDRLLTMLNPYASVVQEYTIEINPEQFDDNKAQVLKKHGVNRASIGFQSSNTSLLKMMNRHHTLNDVQMTMELLRDVAIDNISLDLMYSLPNQTVDMLHESVKDALRLKPTHLSLYSLTIEPNTLFARKGYQHLDDDMEADMYEWICDELSKQGFEQYEISNFAKDEKYSLHNQAYWNYQDFYGIGCGASGKENGERYDIPKDVKAYIQDPTIKDITTLMKQDQMFEAVMMGLRLKKGIQLDVFQAMFGVSLVDVYPKAIHDLIKSQDLILDEAYLKCSPKGYEILNTILLSFMD